MSSSLSVLRIAVLFICQCFAQNATTTTVDIYGLNSNKISYTWNTVYGSVVAADSHALTIHLDCRPNLPTSCTDQDATITAGPTTYAYTSSSSSYFAHMACSKTALGSSFTCSWKNHLRDSMSFETLMTMPGSGGQAPIVITAGVEKMTVTPTAAANGTTRLSRGSIWAGLILSWGGIGYAYLIGFV